MKNNNIKYTNIGKLLSFWGYDNKNIKKIINKKDFVFIIRDLLLFLDFILKSEKKHPFHYDFFVNKYLMNESVFNYDILSLIVRVKDYLNRVNLSSVRLDPQSKTSFLFILENVYDFYSEYLKLKDKKDREDLINVFSFWITNLVKTLDEIFNGEINFKKFKNANGFEEVVFSYFDTDINLSPYLLYDKKDNVFVFLNEITKEGFVYIDKNKEVKLVYIDENYFKIILENSLNTFSLEDIKRLEKIKGYYNKEIPGFFLLKDMITNIVFRSFSKVENVISKTGNMKSKFPVFIYILGYIKYLNLEYEDALRIIGFFVNHYPYLSSGYELLADINYKLKRYDTSLKYYEMTYNIFKSDKIKTKINNLKTIINENKEQKAKRRYYNEEILDFSDNMDVPIISREKEVSQLIEILISKTRNNVLIVGDTGIGKTTLIKLFSKKLKQKDVPFELKNKKLKELNFVTLLTGSKYRGQFEEKALKFLIEFSKSNDILVLENIHLMSSSGSSRGTSLDFLIILREFLKDNNIQVIATTTYEELKNTIEKDNYLISFFQKIMLMELTKEDSEKILRFKSKNLLEEEIIVPDDLITNMVDNAKRYIREKRLPDSAIMIFERSISKFKMNEKINSAKEISEDIVRDVIGDLLNTSINNITLSFKKKLIELEENLNKVIIGQEEATKRLTSSIITSKMEYYTKPSRPDGVFLFIGPTGVGKTETAIALTKLLYGSEDYLIRIDMSEYMEKFTYSRFVGSAPGYVGYNDTNQLTDKVRQNPFSVILLDEIEKADPDLLSIFLQIFDAGRLTDAKGNTVDFSNTTFVMTSNIGTSLYGYTKMGYEADVNKNYVSNSMLIKNLKKYFTPEFLNRIDDVIIFNHLTKDDIKKIIDLQLVEVRKKLSRENKSLDIKTDVFDYLAEKGYSKEYGARNLSRVIIRKLLEKIAILNLSKEWDKFKEILCFVEGDEIIVRGIIDDDYFQENISNEIVDFIVK